MPFLGVAGIGGLVAFLKKGALPTVLGGILSEDSTYFYRTFRGSSSLTVTGGALTADILVVAGGGAGSQDRGGGGGAGGLVGLTAQVLAPTTHAVTVGAGGAGRTTGQGLDGTSSQFGVLTAAVGGGGGGDGGAGANGRPGGSGGGGGNYPSIPTGAGGAGTAGQGNAGGTGTYTSPNYGAGGGGGAGGVGGNGWNGGSGNGGVGLATYSSWATATGTGSGGYYAGGGGGGSYLGGTNGTGGAGGGGNGVRNGTSNPGVENTGGGGGSNGEGGSWAGGSGGSGVVIVRYLKTAVMPSTDAFELIGTIALSTTQAQLVFAGIPQQYKHLQLRMTSRTDRSASATADVFARVNGDSGANYGYHQLYGYNNSAASGATSSSTEGLYLGSTAGATSVSGAFGTLVMDLLDFASTTKNNTSRYTAGTIGTSATTGIIGINSSLWRSTAAVTSLTVYCNQGNFVSGTRASLYGLRG